MKIALITGAGGLVGSQSVEFFSDKFDVVIGVDNDLRRTLFGDEASTAWNIDRLVASVPNYRHVQADIRDEEAMRSLFAEFGSDIALVVHAAAQPSHDWAASDPFTDFTVNANGTLVLLEMTRRFCPRAVFAFCSTNKVYGDRPNGLPFVELETRWELPDSHPFHARGIDESMSLDCCKHSLFGASKVSADILVQEYGRYFGMNTMCLRGGCLTGPNHSGTMLHGFLSYLMKCAITGTHYRVFGYKGKQVRDNIHVYDFVNMIWHYYQSPRPGEVYNAGGSRHSNCSLLEVVAMCEAISGKHLQCSYTDQHRQGDHVWWISDVSKFRNHYPDWDYTFSLRATLEQIHDTIAGRLVAGA